MSKRKRIKKNSFSKEPDKFLDNKLESASGGVYMVLPFSPGGPSMMPLDLYSVVGVNEYTGEEEKLVFTSIEDAHKYGQMCFNRRP